jgi:hypothetical protein
MKILTLTLIVPAAVAAAIALPAIASAGVPPTFETPSENIMCWVGANMATCHIVDYTYALAPGACPDGEFGGQILLKKGESADLRCSSTPPGTYQGLRTDTTLDYGQSASRGVMTCASEQSGVTCTDTSSGHFFRISKDSYELG